MNTDYFESAELTRLDGDLAAARTVAARTGIDAGRACALWSTFSYDRVDPRTDDSLAGLTRAAKTIVSARVVGAKEGFYLGHPGTLLEIEVTRFHRSAAGGPPPQTFLVFYQYARIDVGGTLLCSRPDGGGPPPAVGASALLFVSETFSSDPASANAPPLVPFPGEEEFLFETNGTVRVPDRLRDLPDEVLFRALEEAVDKLLHVGPEPGA